MSLLPLPKGRSYGINDSAQAETCLRNAGYKFLPLWSDIPSLKECSKDLSIVIPIYNDEKFLRKCLDSIIEQDTKYDYEIICINDGSTDKSGDILAEYASKHQLLKVISQENQGISVSRNRGIEEALGRYIGFIDNDDTVAPDYVESIMNVAIKEDADMVQTSFDYCNSIGTPFNTSIIPNKIIQKEDKPQQVSDIQGFVWGGVMRKALFEKVRFPVGFWYEDMITIMIMVRLTNKIVHIGKVLYHKTVHDSNASNLLWKKGSIQSSDQFWLARSFCEYADNFLGLHPDEFVYANLVNEWTRMLVSRTSRLADKQRYALFKLASDYLQSLHLEYNPRTIRQRIAYHALMNGDYIRWKAIGYSMMWHG